MIKKLLRSIFVALVMLTVTVVPVLAADFALTSIGNYDTSDGVPTQIWYTSTQPTFSGTGTSGSTVNISVDSTSYSTTVAATEQWSWIPPQPLTSADHNIVLTSGSDSISFILTIGSGTTTPTPTPEATTTPTPTTATVATTTTLPESGGMMPTLIVLGLALGLMTLPAVRRWAFTDK